MLAKVEQATSSIAHRGPDDSGIEVVGPVAMGFRRLAILDLTPAGHQPMKALDGLVTLVFNGEIYNFDDLRAQLRERGHSFRSTGDTEVVLRGYLEWGTELFARLNGMFAIAIADGRTRNLVVARDRFGIKPLFVHVWPDGVALASEIKALRALRPGALAPSEERWAQFLLSGRTESLPEDGSTFLEGVRQVDPGTVHLFDYDGGMTVRRYATPASRSTDGGESVGTEQIADRLRRAVRLQVRSDVPVGVLLSGGIDSSTIACLAAETRHGADAADPLQAFCYNSPDFDESAQIDAVVAHGRLDMHRLQDDGAMSAFHRLRKVLWHHDEPFHSPSVLAGFELYRLAASQGIRVALSGQGADEVFAGYPSFLRPTLRTLWTQRRIHDLVGQSGRYAALQKTSKLQLLVDVAAISANSRFGNVAVYRGRRERTRIREIDGAQHLSADLRTLLQDEPLPHSGANTLDEALQSAVYDSPLPKYLAAEDRNSMAHGVETRVPFLDQPLVELGRRLPIELLMWDGWNKVAIRRAMKGVVPDVVLDRREKFGFPTSARRWFAGDLVEPMRELLTDPLLARSGWVNTAHLEQLLERHRLGQADHTNVLFAAAQTAVWLDLHERDWN